jgi:hypothetical protein
VEGVSIMAEVSYKSEPTVSVHGVPQSEYNAQPEQYGGDAGGAPQEGGIIGHLKQHWVIYTILIGVAGLVIMYMIYRQNNAASTAAVDTGNSTTGTTTSPSTIDSSWGSQLDADYQQLTSVETTNTGLLQSILNGITGANNPTPTNPTSSPVTSPNASPYTPLMGNASITNPMMGQQFSFEGIVYQLDPGPSGRVYGVQEPASGQQMTVSQVEAAPIGFGVGAKRLLTNKG